MAWGILLLAGLCEIVWAVALKYAGGFTRLLPSVALVHGYRRGGILMGVVQMFTVAITGVCRAVQV